MRRLPAGWIGLVEPLLGGTPTKEDVAVAHDFVLTHGGLPCAVHPTLVPFFEHVGVTAPALIASFTARADVRVPALICAEHARLGVATMLRSVGRAADAHTVLALEPIRSRPAALAAATWVTPDWVRGLRSLTHSAALGNFRRLCSLLAGGPDPGRLGPALGHVMYRVHRRLANATQSPFEAQADALFIAMIRACLTDATSAPR